MSSDDDDAPTPEFEDVFSELARGDHGLHADAGCAPDGSDLAHGLRRSSGWHFDSELESALQVPVLPSVVMLSVDKWRLTCDV
jgi:hypothetical protein